LDFIFMLTRHDRTVEDCLETLDLVQGLGIGHVGFKDVGVDRDTLHALNRRIRDSGAISYMEVVSASPEAALQSARVAVEIGVDRLMGGTQVPETLAILAGSAIEYLPFPGRPEGHPTRLGGSAADVAADCRRFRELGCFGADLLAFRAVEADPMELVHAARDALDGYLMVAGSVDSPERIRSLAAAGVDGFTIGSAVFDGSFASRLGATTSQLREVLAACA
jgi:hypothetical protein